MNATLLKFSVEIKVSTENALEISRNENFRTWQVRVAARVDERVVRVRCNIGLA